jgi:TolB-like protein
MKWITLVLLTICLLNNACAQAIHEAEIEKIGKELAQQAIARKTLKLAVLDFTEGDVVTSFARNMSDELRMHMAIRNLELTIIDRAATERVIEEQRLSSGPLFDENKAAAVGKLVSADAIITGTLTKQGGSWRIAAKLISVETGAVIGGYAGWLENHPASQNELQTQYELPTEQPLSKRLTFHAESSAGVQWVNQTPAGGVGFIFSRMKYRGDAKPSRFDKGKKGLLLGLHYFAGIPVMPNHEYTLGYRMVDFYGNAVRLNSTDVYQDSYFLVQDGTSVLVSEVNSPQVNVPIQLYKAEKLRVDRLRIDLSWRCSLPVPGVNIYAETGLAYSRQFDRSTYRSSFTTPQNQEILNLELNSDFAAPELPAIVELKVAAGAERGRWGIHLEGAITTRSQNYMSPLDMFHHPNMVNWSSMQADLADDGVGEITQKSASEQWYYWLSSIIQLRYQL